MIDRLTDRLIDRLKDWLIDRLIVRLLDRLIVTLTKIYRKINGMGMIAIYRKMRILPLSS